MTGTTETWRKGRKILDGSLRPGAVISYRQMMQEKTREFLSKLRTNTKDFNTHIETSVSHLLMLYYC
jgi:cytochrome P450